MDESERSTESAAQQPVSRWPDGRNRRNRPRKTENFPKISKVPASFWTCRMLETRICPRQNAFRAKARHRQTRKKFSDGFSRTTRAAGIEFKAWAAGLCHGRHLSERHQAHGPASKMRKRSLSTNSMQAGFALKFYKSASGQFQLNLVLAL